MKVEQGAEPSRQQNDKEEFTAATRHTPGANQRCGYLMESDANVS